MTLTKFPSIGKALYGFLFVAVLPAWLITWARMTEASVRLPMAGSFAIGTVLASCGVVIMVCGMAGLIVYGKGMPMNPYPPINYVTQGIYRFTSHPIYTGFSIISIGVAIAANSPSTSPQ